jgi:hypothetical protein
VGPNRGTGFVLVADIMRSTLLTAFLGLSLVGCVATIGDGKSDSTGTADDGVGGDDTGGDDTTTPPPDPGAPAALLVDTDNATLNTELNTTSMLTFNLKPTNFTGTANLTASVVDGTGAPLTGWTVALSTTAVNMGGNTAIPVVATLTIPAQNAGFLAANVKIDATSSLGTTSATSAITALNQVSVEVKEDAQRGDCILPGPTPVTIKLGTKLRIVNKFATDTIIIHSDVGSVFPHEDNNGTKPNEAYEYTPTITTQANQPATWYCHAPASGNTPNKPRFVVVP